MFVSMRYADLVDVMNNAMCLLLMLLGLVVMASMYVRPSITVSYMLRRVFVLVLIYAQLKKTMDSDLTQHLPYRNLQDFRALITIGNGRDDANRIAQVLSNMLVMLNCDVILLCSYADNCEQMVHDIHVTYPNKTAYIHAVNLNIGDLHSVQNFSHNFLTQYNRLDYIIHTAKSSNSPVQNYLGHRLLETLLLPLLLTPIPILTHHNATPAKIVSVVSPSALHGRFPSHLLTHAQDQQYTESSDIWSLLNCTNKFCSTYDTMFGGCNSPEAVFELSTLLYTFELQHRVDAYLISQIHSKHAHTSIPSPFTYDFASSSLATYRRLVTSSVDVGAIHHANSPSLLEYALSYVSKRDAHDGSMVILYAILKDTYTPTSFINGAKNAFDLLDFRHHYLGQHKQVYRGIQLKYNHISANSPLSFVSFWFARTNFVARSSSNLYRDGDGGFNIMSPMATAHRLSQVLYDMTQDTLQAFLPQPKNTSDDSAFNWPDVLMTLA
ncbi:hypothetical protein EON63_02190 [archaeon]|nr:MAG: hypothetical protein EON63_02190 [archaeon]